MSKNNKSNKTPKGGTDRNAVSGMTQSNQATMNEHNEKDKAALPAHKVAPTAEQLRIAQMIDSTHSEKQLQEKVNQVTQITGVTTDDAMIALHDCNHDVRAAIDALLEGENQGEWKESTKKKKKSSKGKEGKDETESNKENHRNDNRERGSSKSRGTAPRSRGRGGRGVNSRDESGDGFGRGSSRKGRMVNGSVGSYRGRGSRGRGSNYRTFQTKQPQGFTETIDTWGEPPIDKIDDVSSLQIDTWGEEPVSVTTTTTTNDEWGDNEWTGSLEHSTVFGPSTSSSSPNPSSSLSVSDNSQKSVSDNHAKASNLGSGQDGTVVSHPDSINMLMGQRSPVTKLAMKGANTFAVPSEAMGLAALLQKAAPHSTVERISAPSTMENSNLGRNNLNSATQSSLLSNLASSVEESMKNSYTTGGTSNVPQSGASQQYSNSGNSMFTNSNVRTTNLASINESAINKALGLVSQSTNMATRSIKQTSRKLPISTSKIPLSAVEMPEDAMAALDMQMAGLEFGGEASSFDFTTEAKPNTTNNMVSSGSSNRDIGTGSGISTAMQQTKQPNLGPEPIPFPTQGGERNTSGGALLTNQRVPTASQNFAAELKKDNSLSGLVGSTPTAAYQSYNSKPTSTSFPSPPTSHFAQSQSQTYSGNNVSGVGSSYPGSVNSNKVSNSSVSSQQGAVSFTSTFQPHTSGTSYQSSYPSASSHSNLSSISVPGLKEQSQQIQNYTEPSVTTLPGSLSTNVSSSVVSNSGPNTLAALSANASSVQTSKPAASGKATSVGSNVPPGVQHMPNHAHQQIMHHALSQTPHHQLQQQIGPQQQTQLVTGHGPSQYVNPPAPLQGAIPPTFYNVQQPAMYSYEDLQMFQRGIPHLAPTSLPGARDGSITSPAASYSAADAAKFRTDQNSSPVPSTISQQAATAGGTYITAAGNAGIPPFYMYHNMAAVPNTFHQYGHPAIIQLPPNTHTGSTTSQFPGPPKLPYGGTSTYCDGMSQSQQDYKTGYGSASQGQNKSGSNATASANNPGSDLTGYKNHFSKVGRSYEKQGFHSGTPPPFNLTGSASNPMTANAYGPAMFFSTVPAAQHHSPLMHHQLHQDASGGNNQRGGVGGNQNKAPSKSGYSGSYWGSN